MDPFTWLLISLVGLAGMFWTIFQKHAAKPVIPGKSEVEVKAEEKAKKDEQVAVEQHDTAVVEAKKEADQKNDALVKDLEEDQQKLLEDDDALNAHLKDIGKDVRGG